jgi:glycerol-3-phosphate acyltransferase PlsY
VEPEAILIVLLAYLIGSIDFGVVLPRIAGVDIYEVGSGNPGASNVLRTMGKRWGAVVMLADLVKGLVAVLIADQVAGEVAGYAAMFAVVFGHCYPIWHRFRGGKGVAAALGALLWLQPIAGVIAVLVWGTVVAVWRIASIASLLTVAIASVAVPLLGTDGWSLAWFYATMVLIVYRHRGNIARILAGGERRVSAT